MPRNRGLQAHPSGPQTTPDKCSYVKLLTATKPSGSLDNMNTTRATQTYRVDDNAGTTLGLVTALSPASALRKVCGDALAEQDGRYGTLADGRHVAALLIHRGRRYLGGHENGR